jgi:hypothetical protein
MNMHKRDKKVLNKTATSNHLKNAIFLKGQQTHQHYAIDVL